MAKRSPEEILEAIEQAPLDDEMERILAMSPEQRRAELEAAGVDLGEVQAAADAVYEKMQGAEGALGAGSMPRGEGAAVVPIARAKRGAVSLWLVAAGVALLLGGLAAVEGPAIVAWLKGLPEPIQPYNEKPRPATPRELAEKARDAADTACTQQLWGTCIDRLDEAKKLDPAGEGEERVQRMRAAIQEGTTFKPGPDKKKGGR